MDICSNVHLQVALVIAPCPNAGFHSLGVLKLCMDVKVSFGTVYTTVLAFHNSLSRHPFSYPVSCSLRTLSFNHSPTVLIGKDDMVQIVRPYDVVIRKEEKSNNAHFCRLFDLLPSFHVNIPSA